MEKLTIYEKIRSSCQLKRIEAVHELWLRFCVKLEKHAFCELKKKGFPGDCATAAENIVSELFLDILKCASMRQWPGGRTEPKWNCDPEFIAYNKRTVSNDVIDSIKRDQRHGTCELSDQMPTTLHFQLNDVGYDVEDFNTAVERLKSGLRKALSERQLYILEKISEQLILDDGERPMMEVYDMVGFHHGLAPGYIANCWSKAMKIVKLLTNQKDNEAREFLLLAMSSGGFA